MKKLLIIVLVLWAGVVWGEPSCLYIPNEVGLYTFTKPCSEKCKDSILKAKQTSKREDSVFVCRGGSVTESKNAWRPKSIDDFVVTKEGSERRMR